MRVAVIGAGGAGLAATWLLEEQHDVVLFERDDRLGGHAHTVEIEAHGQRFGVDAGFEFFGAGAPYVTFNRYLDALGVARRTYPATMSLTAAGRTTALPPWRGRPVWRSLTPRALRDMILFRRFLSGIPAFLAQHDTTLTTGEYLDALRLPPTFRERFLLPVLLAFWCVEPEELRAFAAYNTFFYLAGAAASGLRPPSQSAIEGGMRTYVAAVERDLGHAEVRTAAAVVRIERDGAAFTVQDDSGAMRTVDQLVFATNARQALALLEPLGGFDEVCAQLRRFEYFDTTIAVHGDASVMPADRSAWSVVNIRWDGVHSQNSVWDPERALPVFRSWVTYDTRMPHPLYAVATYEHGKVTPDYYDAQARLVPLQGVGGVWLAGLYTADADSHESAVQSAVVVARGLSPDSARLALIDGADE